MSTTPLGPLSSIPSKDNSILVTVAVSTTCIAVFIVIVIIVILHLRKQGKREKQMYLSRLDYIDDDSDDELITSMEPVDVFVNSNEPTFVYTNQNQGPIVTFKNEQY
ncbi:Hypothetical predicted protein [Mytilus galloprovincialis]|uniref:Uncharacterized protein n=1 Tax=Mytilus galloprovincialis TaxID=29158 RepID=A0A8B6BN92_MYTGA|nr:Hypothetical predicted protein [Mytilus galloprovincialis]